MRAAVGWERAAGDMSGPHEWGGTEGATTGETWEAAVSGSSAKQPREKEVCEFALARRSQRG